MTSLELLSGVAQVVGLLRYSPVGNQGHLLFSSACCRMWRAASYTPAHRGLAWPGGRWIVLSVYSSKPRLVL